MRTPLSACCKTPSSAPCAEVDGCIKGIVSEFRIAGLMGLIRELGSDLGDVPGVSGKTLLEKA